MTLVIIPPLLNGAGEAIPGKARITLVDAQGRIRVGWSTADGTAVTESLSVTLGAAPVQVPLRPQSAIALDVAGSPTWYEITLTQAGTDRRDTHRFQVPDSASPERLADLIGAATIPAGSLLAGRLVPEGGGVGQVLTRTAPNALGWANAGTGSSSLIEHPFAWGDANPATVGIPLQGQTVFRAEIVITSAFDGAGASLKLGDAGNNERLIAAADVDPAQVAVFETAPAVTFDGLTAVLLTIVPGSAASAGRGVVRLYL
jgi:hypothetical protein